MATLANLVVRITGNTASLNKAVSKAEGRMDRFKKGSSKAFAAVRKAALGLAIGGAAAITGFAIGAIKNFADLGDELDKMSKRTGVSVETLSELKFAAEQSGASLETIEKALKRMATTILDADMGLSTATDALDAIGLSVEQLQGLNPEQQFLLIANALAGVEDASTRAALAQRIFGRSGTELLPLFTSGAEGMEALRKEARELGVVMSQEDAAAAAEFNDSLNRLKSVLQGLGFAIAKEIIPQFTEWINGLIEGRKDVIAFATGSKEAIEDFFATFNLLTWLQEKWDSTWSAIEDKYTTVSDAISSTYESSWGWLRSGATDSLAFLNDKWNKVFDHIVGYVRGPLVKGILFFRDNWNEIWDHVKAVIRSVADVVLPIIDRIIAAVSRVTGAVSSVGSIAGSIAGSIGGGIGKVIPGLAAGGNVRSGGAALVGERGPELVSLPRGAQVSPMDGSGGMGGTTVNYYSLTAADFRREVERITNAPGAKARSVGRP